MLQINECTFCIICHLSCLIHVFCYFTRKIGSAPITKSFIIFFLLSGLKVSLFFRSLVLSGWIKTLVVTKDPKQIIIYNPFQQKLQSFLTKIKLDLRHIISVDKDVTIQCFYISLQFIARVFKLSASLDLFLIT